MLSIKQTFLADVYGNEVTSPIIYSLCECLERLIKDTPELDAKLSNRQLFYADAIALATQYYEEAMHPSTEYIEDSIASFVYHFEDSDGDMSWEDSIPTDLYWLNIHKAECNIKNYTNQPTVTT